jgi:DNA methyltransferase 1-associated protein 1
MEIDSEPQAQSQPVQKDYEFAKFNIQVTVPTFTDEQYERDLRDPTGDWSREETEYLLSLIKDYYQKWPVIYDRYDWRAVAQPRVLENEEGNVAPIGPVVRERSMEDMKSRYYFICAKAMEFSLPKGVAGMNAEEYSLHGQYIKFNPELEKRRKQLAWALCLRDEKDIKEEEFLLSELQRIMISAQKYETERAELRQRLEHAQPLVSGNGLSMPLSSATLNQLSAQLQAQDRNRKPRARISIDAMQSPATVGGGLTTPASAGGHRDSLGGANKRVSIATQPSIRQLSPRDETRFGITTHDRLTSGVTFRTDKLLKLRQAKSNIQTQKIHQALAQLDIPELLSLPTTKVVQAYETLIQKINLLLDAKKVLTKEENELQTAVNIKAEIEKQKAEANGEVVNKDTGDEDDAEGEEDAEGEDDDDVEMTTPGQKEPEPETIRPSSSKSNAHFKRDGSVLSTASSRASKRKR